MRRLCRMVAWIRRGAAQRAHTPHDLAKTVRDAAGMTMRHGFGAPRPTSALYDRAAEAAETTEG